MRKLCVDNDFSTRLSNGIFDYATVLDAMCGCFAALEKFAETFNSIDEPSLCCDSCTVWFDVILDITGIK